MRVSATRRIPSLGDRVRRASVHGGGLSRARVASLGAALIGIFCSFGPSAAGAQDASCFGGRSEEAAQRVVDLSERLTPSAECEYSLSRGGPFRALPEALLTQEAGFLDLFAHLAGSDDAAPDQRPRFVFARPSASRPARPRRRSPRPAAVQALALRFCSHYLMEEEIAFRLRAGDELLLERTSGPASCGAEGLELRAFPEGEQGPMIRMGASEQTLETGGQRLRLEHGSWAFYAARPGSPVALRIGQLSSRSAHSPLRSHLRAAQASSSITALMRAGFDGSRGSLRLVPAGEGLSPSLWSELRTAAAAGALWLAHRPATSREAPTALEPLHVVEGGDAATLSDAAVADLMARRYGPVGASMAPAAADWVALFEELSICVGPSYREPAEIARSASIPPEAECTTLSKVARPPAPQSTSDAAGGADLRVCIERGRLAMRADGAQREAGVETCYGIVELQQQVPIAIVGDRVRVEGLEGACVLVRNEPLEGEGALPLERTGLLEIRVGSDEGCGSQQGLALARLAVIDPQRQWHPVGLHTSSEDPPEENPWAALRHDEPDVFAFSPSRQALDFRLSVAESVTAAFRTSGGSLLASELPILGGVRGRLEGARSPALGVYLSRQAACPDAPLAELLEEVPLDPEGLPIDATFYAHLIAPRGDGLAPLCLSRARLRLRTSRALLAGTAEVMRYELDLLGDARALVFLTPSAAFGVSLSILDFRLTFFDFLSLDLAANVVGAAAFDPVELSRTGLGLSVAVEFGVPELLPRLLSVGMMLHVAADTQVGDDPLMSFFVGLNLSTLVDVAGGR